MSEDSWYKPRTYLHFDKPIGLKRARSLVSDPSRVAAHPFLPFISFVIKTQKLVREDSDKGFKRKIKKRPIAYASHADAQIYSYYAHLLSLSYEEFIKVNGLDDAVLAFRALGKSNINFALTAFNSIVESAPCAAVALDVSGFFENLDHAVLKRCWARVIGKSKLPDDHYAVFKSLTKYSIVTRDSAYKEFSISVHNPRSAGDRICSAVEFRARIKGNSLISSNATSRGIPQGSPISAILSNIYLMDFDVFAQQCVRSEGGTYFRYCDDILLIVPTHTRNEIVRKIVTRLTELKLAINEQKTEVRSFEFEDGVLTSNKPLQYLGFTFDGQRILIRSAALARYSQNMKRAVRLATRTMTRWNRIRAERGQPPRPIYRKAIYMKYSHLGKQNFLRYGYKAAKIMSSPAIRGQLKALWPRLLQEIDEAK